MIWKRGKKGDRSAAAPAVPAELAAFSRSAADAAPPPPDAAASEVSAAATGQQSSVRIVFDGRKDRVPIELVSRSEGAVTYLNTNGSDTVSRTSFAVLNLARASADWQQGEWVIRPQKDGAIELRLEALWTPTRRQFWMLYDDLQVDGALLAGGDFEGEVARKLWKLDPLGKKATQVTEAGLARGGRACVRAGTSAPAAQRIQVQDGKEVKLTFWYRLPPDHPTAE